MALLPVPKLRKVRSQGGKAPNKRETQNLLRVQPYIAVDADGLWPTGGMAAATYDFTVSGGTQGTIDLGITLPANAVITGVRSEEITDVTSGGSATVTVQLGSTAITSAIGFATFANVTSHTVPVFAKQTTSQNLKITIGTADLTAGKVRFYVTYHVINTYS